jgi:fatty acid-binding protein DegV
VAKDLPEGYAMEAIIAHVDAHEDAASLAKGLAERYSFATPPAITTLGPALAVHGGLGALALAYFLPEARS